MNPDGTSDLNAVSLYESASGMRLRYLSIDGSKGTAALKITSRATNLRIDAGQLIGGSENCVDLNNECSGIAVHCDEYHCRGKYAISAKTCSGVSFSGHIVGRAAQWEVNLGPWSDQSSRVQTGTTLKLTADVYPIRVWVGNATAPAMDDPKKYKLLGFGRYGKAARVAVMFFWDVGKRLNLV